MLPECSENWEESLTPTGRPDGSAGAANGRFLVDTFANFAFAHAPPAWPLDEKPLGHFYEAGGLAWAEVKVITPQTKNTEK